MTSRNSLGDGGGVDDVPSHRPDEPAAVLASTKGGTPQCDALYAEHQISCVGGDPRGSYSRLARVCAFGPDAAKNISAL